MTGVVEDTVGTLVVDSGVTVVAVVVSVVTLVVDSGVTVVAVVVSVVRVVGVIVDSTSSVVTVGDDKDGGTLDTSTVEGKRKQT